MEKIKIELTQKYMNEIISVLLLYIEASSENYSGLKGHEHLCLEAITKLYKNNNKVMPNDPPTKKYNLVLTKGQAFVLWEFGSRMNKSDEYFSLTYVLPIIHQKIS